tara:strand:+ start:1915 stop:2586 length:672 start_codon:yes stop_codon:yes gene_type:complete
MMSLFLDCCSYKEHATNIKTNTDSEEIENIRNQVVDKVMNIIGTKIDDNIKKKCDQSKIDISKQVGPKGPRGDPGGTSVTYQGLYSFDKINNPVTSELLNDNGDVMPRNFNNNNGNINNSVQFRNNKLSNIKFLLRNEDQWQLKENGNLVNRSNTDYPICDNGGNIYLCNDPAKQSVFDYDNNMLKVKHDTEINCLTYDSNKLVLKKCPSKDEMASKFKWSLR